MDIIIFGIKMQNSYVVEDYVIPIIRMATQEDEPFLWEMLYYAAHMDEDGTRFLDMVIQLS